MKRVDTGVVYKVDRLTHSLADFAKIVDQFHKQGISFVSAEVRNSIVCPNFGKGRNRVHGVHRCDCQIDVLLSHP